MLRIYRPQVELSASQKEHCCR